MNNGMSYRYDYSDYSIEYIAYLTYRALVHQIRGNLTVQTVEHLDGDVIFHSVEFLLSATRLDYLATGLLVLKQDNYSLYTYEVVNKFPTLIEYLNEHAKHKL